MLTRDRVGSTMSGPGIRFYHLAAELAASFDVTLMIPNVPDDGPPGVDVVQAPSSVRELEDVVTRYDVVFARPLPLPVMKALARSQTRVIYDLYVPVVTEELAMLAAEPERPQAQQFRELALLAHRFALGAGDAFVCASERQRDFWLGMLAAAGRVDLDGYLAEPTFRSLIDVVAFGVAVQPPVDGSPALKGVHKGIAEDDRVVLWTGGIWNWLDPLTVVRAAAELARTRNDVKLVFLGFDHPEVPRMAMAGRTYELAASLGALNRAVFFLPGWLPYTERGRFLLDADLGVAAHFDTLEARYACRTRVLDHFWAGLPTVTTGGDALAELVSERRLGRVVAAEDVGGWKRAIEELLDDEDERRQIRENLATVRSELAWPEAAKPLARLVRGKLPEHVRKGRPVLLTASDRLLRARIAFALGGPGAALRRQVAKLAGRR